MNKHNIFYAPDGSMITDVSGKKTKEQIANEFSWDIGLYTTHRDRRFY